MDAMLARLKIQIDTQKALIGNNCVNISSLLNRHGTRCKQVVELRRQRPDGIYEPLEGKGVPAPFPPSVPTQPPWFLHRVTRWYKNAESVSRGHGSHKAIIRSDSARRSNQNCWLVRWSKTRYMRDPRSETPAGMICALLRSSLS